MTLKFLIRFSFTLTVIFFCSSAFAKETITNETPAKNLIIQEDKIFDPDKLSFDSLQLYEKKFDYDWTNYATIAPNAKKIDDIQTFLKANDHTDFTKLSAADQEAIAKIAYKLGTFYLHVSHQWDLAMQNLHLASTLFKNKQDQAWNYNQLAYAYERRYAEFDEEQDKNQALTYCNKVLSEIYPRTKNKEVAFAYYVSGLVQNDAADYAFAETNVQQALNIYATLANGQDDQYAIAKNHLANILLHDDHHDEEAITMLKDLKKYWLQKKDTAHNPYAANTFVSLGEANLKIGEPKNARDELKSAITILQNLYGENSSLLIEPYQILADVYKKLGDTKLASAYAHKADVLNKS